MNKNWFKYNVCSIVTYLYTAHILEGIFVYGKVSENHQLGTE
jgi:hypothetical protein